MRLQPANAELARALKFFHGYSSPPNAPSVHKDISVSYIVVTGVKTAPRAEILFETWGRMIAPPHNLVFVADQGMGPNERQYRYKFLNAPGSMIPLRYSTGGMSVGGKDVKSMTDYRRSQLKWLDAIVYLGGQLNDGLRNRSDWFVFADDDTFIIPHALQALLSEYNPETSLLLGKGGKDCHKMCGGAGFAVSRSLMLRLYLCRDALANAFFKGYASGLGALDVDTVKYHSDVVLSNFMLKNRDSSAARSLRISPQ